MCVAKTLHADPKDRSNFVVRIIITGPHIGAATITLYFICQSECRWNSTMPSPPQVTGCVLLTTEHSDAYASRDYWSFALQFPALRGLVVGLCSFGRIRTLAETHPELHTAMEQRLWYCRLAMEQVESEERVSRWIGLDPSSLRYTGTFVDEERRIVRSYTVHSVAGELWERDDIVEGIAKRLTG